MKLTTLKVMGLAVAGAALLSACERPPMDSVQRGYRGVGLVEVFNPRTVDALIPANAVPDPIPAAAGDSPPATSVFKNVQVLNDLTVAEFTREMVAITNWVAPVQGCAYCHNPNDLADDSVYTKVVARRMLQMTRHVNSTWQSHVVQTGVTCYTCHRGQPVPAYTWNVDPGLPQAGGMAGGRHGQNIAAVQVGLASLPNDPFTAYLRNADNIRVVSTTALPAGSERNIKQTEGTYGLMIHMSKALGVGCTHCHNSRSFLAWDQSSPQRALAWYGIRMVRDLNTNYVEPLIASLPPERLGPTGDVPKVNCTTCHQGAYKPLYGVSMLKDYPALGAQGAPLAAAAPAPAPEPVAAAPGQFGKVLFAVGKKDLGAEAVKVIESAARSIKEHPGVKVDLSGFADKTGNPDKNLDLAKQRAFAVRDALKSAGVAADRINLKKPEFVIGGAESESRRVEINAQK